MRLGLMRFPVETERFGMRKVLICLLLAFVAVSAGAETPIQVGSAVLSKQVVKRAPLVYPPIAKAAQVSGTVVDEVTVGPDGNVIAVRTISGPPMLLGAAEVCVKQWKFRPYMKDGKAVAMRGELHFVFSLPPAPPPAPLQKFMRRVRSKYRTEPELRFREFSCALDPAWREFPQVQLLTAESPVVKWLEATKLRIVIKPIGGPTATAKTPSEPKLNDVDLATAKQMVKGTESLAKSFYESWPRYEEDTQAAPSDGRVHRTGDKTELDFTENGTSYQETYDRNLLLVRNLERGKNGDSLVEIPKFESTPKGYLYVGSDVTLKQARSEGHFAYTFDYQDAGNFYLPKTVAMQLSGTVTLHFEFRDCKVNPPAPVPPPIRVNKNTVIVTLRPQ